MKEICGSQLNISVDGRRNRRDIFLEESGRDGLHTATLHESLAQRDTGYMKTFVVCPGCFCR